MEQILDVLYNYIQENRIAYYLNGDPEYCLAGRRMDEAEEWLEANLPPEARARLERLAAARAVPLRAGPGAGAGRVRPAPRIGTTCWPR